MFRFPKQHMAFTSTQKEQRLAAYDALINLKNSGRPLNEIIQKLQEEFRVPAGTLYPWHYGKIVPFGRKGELEFNPDLFYVLGALLGDGCIYNWKVTNHFVYLSGDEKFAKKYAKRLSNCIGKKAKAYPNRRQNVWFVKSNNYKLFYLFKKTREEIPCLERLLFEQDKTSALLFIEGFFDAEGCVKIINERVRKTPKICLDFTNTNFGFLDVVRKLLQKHLGIEGRYSVQEPQKHWKSNNKKTAYHLRIYKRSFVMTFLEKIHTTKLKPKKKKYVVNWFKKEKERNHFLSASA